MFRETIYKFLLVLLSFFSAQGWSWITVGSYYNLYLYEPNDYRDFYVNMIAGKTYAIVAQPENNGLNTTLTVTDPSGYSAFNDDWGRSTYPLSAALNFTPTTTGITVITLKAGYGQAEGRVYTWILDVTPCSASCATCKNYTASDCPMCPMGYRCDSCKNSESRYASTCMATCPNITYNYSSSTPSICRECRSYMHSYCQYCNSTNCLKCLDNNVAEGTACRGYCLVGYDIAGICTNSCATESPVVNCKGCKPGGQCTSCLSGWYLFTNQTCLQKCPDGYYDHTSGVCSSCSSYCSLCNSTVCLSCTSGYTPESYYCVKTCSTNFWNNTALGICARCSSSISNCYSCDNSTTCIECDSGYYLQGGGQCLSSCPAGSYKDSGVCKSCPIGCKICTSSTCSACSSGLVLSGSTCVSSCPSATYNNTGVCSSCSNLDSYCSSCVNNRTCTSCSYGKLVYGAICVNSCPQGTMNTGGICTFASLKVTLSNTDSVSNYLVEITSALVYDVDVPVVSKVTLVGVDPSAYTYTLTRQSETFYLISIQNTQTIPSTMLRFVYTLNGLLQTKNINYGEWTDQITSKYMAYMSEGTKKAVEAVNSVAGGSMQGASVGASSMAVIGGNPALLWTLMNLFQQFYYLSFIDVNFPANVQMFLEIFSLGSLSFIPNPLDWFVSDIDTYSLPVPKRYNDNSFSGLFLDNAGNELLMLSFVFIIFCVCKMMKKWARRLPTSLRFASNKTIGWFQWSGIMESLITSYTDITQAVFLQLKVLTFSSTVFILSSVLCIVTLGFIVAFPVLIILIIRKFNDHPELLTIQYETLVKEYSIDKVAARNFVPIWLVRRLIMCLSLVFLQGYPYVQITLLSLLQIAGIYYCWVYTPYTTRKENICNTLMEILFGGIHVVIYILVYDDHNPYFSDDQRLQLGWMIVFCCGAILILSLGLSLFEQVRMIIRGLRMLKQLMSKKDKIKKGKSQPKPRIEDSLQTDQSTLVDLNRTQTDTSLISSPVLRAAVRASPPPRSMVIEKNLRRARIASRIRELRAMNNS